MKETEIAARVVSWLEHKGWDVYQEVVCRGGVADIVAVKKDVVWIIETKTSFTFQLMDQARDRLECADLVSVAVPEAKRGRTARWILDHFGIGLILVDRTCTSVRVPHGFKPKQTSARWTDEVKESLQPEHKTYAAAGSQDGHWTEFKSTCRNALEHVKRRGSCTMRDLVAEIKHHYSSDAGARATLRDRIEQGVVPGLKLDRSVKPMQVALDGDAETQPDLL